jgi:hypothetical protein
LVESCSYSLSGITSSQPEHDEVVPKREYEQGSTKSEDEMRKGLMTGDNSLTENEALGPSLKKKQQRNWAEIEAAETSIVENLVAEAVSKEANAFEASLKRKKRRTDEETESELYHPSFNTNSADDFSQSLDLDIPGETSGMSITPFLWSIYDTLQ